MFPGAQSRGTDFPRLSPSLPECLAQSTEPARPPALPECLAPLLPKFPVLQTTDTEMRFWPPS